MQANHGAVASNVLSRPVKRRDDLGHLMRVAALIARRMRERRVLANMDEHLLDDAGLVPDDVARRLQRPFWTA
jgi:uncharacterized protein YjiS (DUF1127 family)